MTDFETVQRVQAVTCDFCGKLRDKNHDQLACHVVIMQIADANNRWRNRNRVDEAYIRKCQRALEREEKSVRSGLLWGAIIVACLAASLAIHYFDF